MCPRITIFGKCCNLCESSMCVSNIFSLIRVISFYYFVLIRKSESHDWNIGQIIFGMDFNFVSEWRKSVVIKSFHLINAIEFKLQITICMFWLQLVGPNELSIDMFITICNVAGRCAHIFQRLCNIFLFFLLLNLCFIINATTRFAIIVEV